jgi:predicted XRE-type DNA-binding protein
MKGTKGDSVRKSSGNVFADLGLRNPEEALTKAELAQRICALIGERGLTQVQAAAVLGLDQPKVSSLMRGKLQGFSVERLFRCLKALGQEIEIIIRPVHKAGFRAGPHVAGEWELSRVNEIEVLGVGSNEDTITNLLKHGLERAAEFRQIFLNLMVGKVSSQLPGVEAHTRQQVGVGVPDLTVVLNGEQTVVGIVENKLGAGEGEDQTQRYADPVFFTELLRKLGLSGPAQPAYLYLTLFPAPGPKSSRFRHVTYRDLEPYLEADRSADDPVVSRLLIDFLLLVRDFYAAGELKANDIVADRMQSTNLLGKIRGSFLYFEELLRRTASGSGLQLLSPKQDSKPGRLDYYAEFTKPSWNPAMFDRKTKPIRFDPRRHVQLHFQPQFHVLEGTLDLYLHYHTNPYLPEKEARQLLPGPELAQYEAIRKKFQAELREAQVTGLDTSGDRWNQIGKFPLDFQGVTAEQLIKQLRKAMKRAEPVLDRLVARHFKR